MIDRRLVLAGMASATLLPSVRDAHAKTIAKGTFRHARKKVMGAYVIITGPELKLILSDDFRSSKGPDVLLMLSRSPVGRVTPARDHVIGPLPKTPAGARFDLGVPLETLGLYSSVVVWCREFNVTFGYAGLTVSA